LHFSGGRGATGPARRKQGGGIGSGASVRRASSMPARNDPAPAGEHRRNRPTAIVPM